MSILGPRDSRKAELQAAEAYQQGVRDGLQLAWVRVRARLARMNLQIGPMIFDIDRTVTLYEIQHMLELARDDIRQALEQP